MREQIRSQNKAFSKERVPFRSDINNQESFPLKFAKSNILPINILHQVNGKKGYSSLYIFIFSGLIMNQYLGSSNLTATKTIFQSA
jgi:hypothetical protein